MSDIKVRRSGLATFAIRLGSTITGLAFVIIVTSNLSQSDFGLWLLISRVLAYMVFVGNILYFWTTRYRARNVRLGKTVTVGALIFSAVLAPVYLLISAGVANLVAPADIFASNFHYFLVALPQVPLYIIVAVIEAILWGSKPARASLGFGLFEIAKVFIGFVTVGIFHLSLTGAILAVMGAQVVQLVVGFVLTRKEYDDKVSFPMIGTMVRTGWVALLNSVQPYILNFDFLIVGALTASTLPLAIYGVAFTLASVISYSGSIAAGLYAGLLAGKDPQHSTTQVLELQFLFLFPMTAGEIIMAAPLMHLLKPIYASGAPILMILALSQALLALSLTFDNIIAGTDTTDASGRADFASYLKSRMFFLSKVNVGIGIAYLIAVAVIAFLIRSGPATILGYSRDNFLGICWAGSALCMFIFIVVLKIKPVQKISSLKLPRRTMVSFIISTAAYAITLSVLLRFIYPIGGEIAQATYIIGLGILSLAVYFALIFALSDSFRRLAKVAFDAVRESIPI
ncbi:MAG: hypothetical protein ACYC7D_13660 [Nitrososphaerales archaeon]